MLGSAIADVCLHVYNDRKNSVKREKLKIQQRGKNVKSKVRLGRRSGI